MNQDEEPNKKVDEIALALAELFVLTLDEKLISKKMTKDDNEQNTKSK